MVIYAAGWNYDWPGQTVIGSVKIEENVYESEIISDVNNGYVGRMFGYGESDEMHITFTNTAEDDYSASAKYTITDSEGKKVGSGSIPETSVAVGMEEAITVNTGVRDCGIYDFCLDVTVSKNGETVGTYQKTYPFSVIRTLNDSDKRMPIVGAVVHLRPSTPDRTQILEVLKRTGIAATRDEIQWGDLEQKAGVYELEEQYKKKLDYLADAGFEGMLLFADGNKLYNGGIDSQSYFTGSDAEIKAYAEAAKWIAENLSDGKKEIEILNEWNIPSFNSQKLGVDVYIKYCKAAYEAIKSVDPEIQVVACTLAGYDVNFLENFMKLGGLEYCDQISYHPYQVATLDLNVIKSQGETTKAFMQKYGGEIKPINLSEFGYSTAIDSNQSLFEPERKSAIPKYYLYTLSHDYADKIYYYCLIDGGSAETGREWNFGIINYPKGLTSLTAMESFVTLCAMMDLVQDGTPLNQIETESDQSYAHEYVRSDGKHVAALWTMGNESKMSLNLGTNKIKMYDMYGTELAEVSSGNGVYSFDISDEIVYIEGDFKKFEKADGVISQEKPIITVLQNDSVKTTFTDKLKRNLNIALEYNNDVLEVISPENMANGKAELTIKAKDGITGTYHIDVKLYDEFGTYYSGKTQVDITDKKIQLNFSFSKRSDDNDKRWKITAEVTNLSNTYSITGDCYIKSPSHFAIERKHFTNIYPNETRKIVLNVPEIILKRPELVYLEVELDGNEKYSISSPLDFTEAKQATVAPVVDGIASPGEYDDAILLAENRADRFTVFDGKPWGGLDDCSLKYRMKWDSEKLYFYCEIKDNIHNPYQGTNYFSMWQGDGLQLAIYKTENTGIEDTATTFTELCIADPPAGPRIYRHTSVAGKPEGIIDGCETAIIRNDGETIYEFAVPWNQLFDDFHEAKTADRYRFSMLVNDSDGGSNRHGWMNYNEGIGTTKNSLLFGVLTLK